MKHFTSVKDIDNLSDLIQKAQDIKRNPLDYQDLGKNKTLGLIFLNSSLRTRLSTQVAAQKLGMSVVIMNINAEGWKIETAEGTIMNGDKAEHLKDAAAVIGQYCDMIGIRSFARLKNKEEDYEEKILNFFLEYAGVPIVSLESATRHPLQSLADVLTIEEYKKVQRPKVVLTWAPHVKALPQAVPNSFVEWMQVAEVDLVVTHPPEYRLASEFMGDLLYNPNQEEAFREADFIYAKNWSSYTDYGKIIEPRESWTVTEEKMKLTRQAYFMHCLPVRRNLVASDQVLDCKESLILAQAENRMFTAQVVLYELLKNL